MTTLHFFRPGERRWAPCVRCDGTGVVWSSRVNGDFQLRPHVCPECDATGRIYDVEPEDEA